MRTLGRVAPAVAAGLLLLCGCNTRLLAQTDVLDVDSFQNVNPTGNATLPAAWDLKYSFDCSKERSRGIAGANRFSMIVFNSDDNSTNAEHPEVTVQGNKGAQTLHFKRGGTFHVQVDSLCDWHLAIVDTGGHA